MTSHRKSERRSPLWRAITAILGVIALVVAMAVTGSSAYAENDAATDAPPPGVNAPATIDPEWVVTADVSDSTGQLTSGATVAAGAVLTYSLHISNSAAGATAPAAGSVSVTDDLSTLLDSATVTTDAADLASSGLSLDANTGILTWTPTFNDALTADVSFEITVNDQATGGTTLATSAAVSGGACEVESCATSLTVQGAAMRMAAAAVQAVNCPDGTGTWPVTASPVGGFEIDGNLCVNGGTNGGTLDWSNAGSQPAAKDPVSTSGNSKDPSGFTTGAKESNYPWDGKTGGSVSPNDNTDIGNLYAWTSTVGSSVFTYFGFERATNVGSVAYYVELNALQNRTQAGGAISPVPNRSVGDLRLTFDQTGNSADSGVGYTCAAYSICLIGASKWDGTSWTPLPSLALFAGQVNQKPTVNLSGAPIDQGQFAEVAVNLSLLFGGQQCSGNYGVLNVRSAVSPSETASLSDWIDPIPLTVPSTCASVQVNKTWVIDGTTYSNDELPAGFAKASLSLDGQTNLSFGTEYKTSAGGAFYKVGDSVTVAETLGSFPPGCTNSASGDIGTKSLTAGLNTFTITNTVTCTYLTLEKKVVGGSAQPSAFTLSAAGPTNVIGAGNSEAVTKVHVKPGPYTLTENDGFFNYQQTGLACTPKSVSGNSITLAAGDDVVCTFTNTATASVVVNKIWTVDGTTYDPNVQPTGFSASPVVTGETGTSPTAFGIMASGYLYGETVNVGETQPTLPAGCTNTAGIGIGLHTLEAGKNTFVIYNTVTCTYLTLVKDVVGGSANASDWTLTAKGPDPSDAVALSGPTNSGGVTKVRVEPGTYTLSESGPSGYEQTNLVCTGATVSGLAVTVSQGHDVTCTFTNTAVGKLTLQKQWINGAVGDKTTLSVETGTDATSTADGGADQTDTSNVVSVNMLAGASVALSESLDSGNTGSYTSTISCTQGGLVSNSSGDGGTYTMPSDAKNVTCTITNTRTSTQLELVKKWVNGAPHDSTILSATGADGSPTTATDEVGGTPGTVTVTALSGATVPVSETMAAVNTGAYSPALACTAGTVSGAEATSGSVTVPKDLTGITSPITCTYTNTRSAVQVSLRKVWIDGANGDQADLSINGASSGSGAATSVSTGSTGTWGDTHGATLSVPSGSSVTLREALSRTNSGSYVVTGFQCTGGSAFSWSAGAASATVIAPASGTVTCTVTNTRKTAVIMLQKKWVNGFAGDTAELTVGGSANAKAAATSTSNGTKGVWTDGAGSAVATYTALSGATIDLSEVLGSGNHGDYAVTDLACEGATVKGWTSGSTSGSIVAPGSGTVTCTITNARTSATLVLNKHWDDAAASDTAELTVNPAENQLSGFGTATATVPEGGTGDATQTVSVTVFSGDTLRVGETLPSTNVGTYDSAISCTPGTGFTAADLGRSGTLIVPKPALADNITCTVTNTRTKADLTLVKEWVNGHAGDTAQLTAGTESATSTADGTSGSQRDTTHVVTIPVLSGASVALSESWGAGNAATYAPTLVCNADGLGTTSVTADGISGTYTMPTAAADVTCTITNTNVPGIPSVSKSVSVNGATTSGDGTVVKPGDTLTWTITVKNAGPGLYSGELFSDNVSRAIRATSLVNDATSFTVTGDGVSIEYHQSTHLLSGWAHDLRAGANVTITYLGVVAAQSVLNDAGITKIDNSAVPKGTATCDTDCTTHNPLAPVWNLTKAVDQGTAQPGGSLTYTLTATNTGSVKVKGATATDTLPSDVTYAGSATGTGTFDAATGVWHIGDIAVGTSVSIAFTVTVGPSAAGTRITNIVVPGPNGQCAGDNGADCTVHTDVPAWHLAKTSDPGTGATVQPGSTITYTLTATNAGDVPVTGASATDTLPTNATVTDSDADLAAQGLAWSDESHTTLVWTIPTIDAGTGTSRSATYHVQVDAAAFGQTVKNQVTPESPGGRCEAEGDCTTENPTPHYQVWKTANPASGSMVQPGSTIVYTLHVHNDSQGTVTKAVVTDPLPDNVSFGAFITPSTKVPGSYDTGSRTVTFDVPTLAAGADSTLSFTVKVDAGAYGQTVTNTAVPSSGGDCVEPGENETRSCTTEHHTPPAANITVAKVWAGSPVSGDQVELGIHAGDASVGTGLSTVGGSEGDHPASADVEVGANATISESFTVGSASNYTATWQCTVIGDDQQPVVVASGDGASGTFTVAEGWADGVVSCAFTNTRTVTPPPGPQALFARPAIGTPQCILQGDVENLEVSPVVVNGISYSTIKNADGSVTVTAKAEAGYQLTVPAGWTDHQNGTASITVTPDSHGVICVGGESSTVPTPPTSGAAHVKPTKPGSIQVLPTSQTAKPGHIAYTGFDTVRYGVLALLLLLGGAALVVAGTLRRKPRRH